MTDPRIETIGGHALLHCRIAVYDVPPGDTRAEYIEDAENVRWLRKTLDFSVVPVQDWGEWREDDGLVTITLANGDSWVLDMAPATFERIYTDWLVRRKQRSEWPRLN